MPFIVSLFKYIILVICFLFLVVIALAVIAVVDPGGPLAGVATPYAIALALGAIILMILNLGGVAILISLHDRHREIAEGINRIAGALERSSEAGSN